MSRVVIAALLWFTCLSSSLAQPTVTAIKVAGSEERVRIVVSIDDQASSKLKLYASPPRLAIDFERADFRLSNTTADGNRGFLEAIRFGAADEGMGRIVVSTDRPFLVERSFALPSGVSAAPDAAKGVTQVIDLIAVSEIAFRRALARQAQLEQFGLSSEAAQKEIAALGRTGINNAVTDALSDDGLRTLKTPNDVRTIVIDPGHGGIDGGATAKNGNLEKHLVLAFAKKLETALGQYGDFNISLTRTDDRFLGLRQRVEIAREREADLFVSIHADSFPRDRSVRGAAIYTLSDRASNSMAAEIAAQENKSDAIGGLSLEETQNDVVDILLSLTRRETDHLSVQFARHMIDDLRDEIRFFKRPHQTAAFRVLKIPDIPSALIELGFLSNNADAERISSQEWREHTADAMARAIAAFFEQDIPLAAVR